MDIQVTDLNVTFTSGGANVTAAVVAELAVAQGAMLAVAGPSGSGKTSLLHALAGHEGTCECAKPCCCWTSPVATFCVYTLTTAEELIH